MGLELILLIVAFVVIVTLIVVIALAAHGRRQKRAAKAFINSGVISPNDVLLIGRHQLGRFSMSQWVFVAVGEEQIAIYAEFIQISGGPTQYDTFILNHENIHSLSVQENKKINVNIKADVVSKQYGYTSAKANQPMEFNLYLKPYLKDTDTNKILSALNVFKKEI